VHTLIAFMRLVLVEWFLVYCVSEEEKEQISEQVIDAMLENKSESVDVQTVPDVKAVSEPTKTESSADAAQESTSVAETTKPEKTETEGKPEVSTAEPSSELDNKLEASGNLLKYQLLGESVVL